MTFTADTSRTSTGTVTLAGGGTIGAVAEDGTAFELVVPPNAVPADTEITLTPLADLTGLDGATVFAVQLEPEGLELFEWARLTITPAGAMPVESQTMIEADGDGTDARLALIDPAADDIVLLFDHFSIGAATSFTPAQQAAFLRKSAANADFRINNEIRNRLRGERAAQLGGESASDEQPDVSDLTAEYKTEVVDKLRAAAELDCKQLPNYLRKAIAYERQLQLLVGLTEAEEQASLARAAEAATFAQSRFDQCEREAIAECTAAKDTSILIRFWLANERPADVARAERLCLSDAFQFEFSGQAGVPVLGGGIQPITWHYWGLKCSEAVSWQVWEVFDGIQQNVNVPPGQDFQPPIEITFDDNGIIMSSTWAPLGAVPGTLQGTGLQLSPNGTRPTEVVGTINEGEGTPFTDRGPVVPYDGSFRECPEEAPPG